MVLHGGGGSSYTNSWNESNLKSGIYYYKLEVNGAVMRKKFYNKVKRMDRKINTI